MPVRAGLVTTPQAEERFIQGCRSARPKFNCGERKSPNEIATGRRVKEAWARSSNLLDYPEENGLKSDETEGRTKERHAD